MSAKLAGLLARLRRRHAGHTIYPPRRLQPGPLSPAPAVPDHIPRPPYATGAHATKTATAPPRAPGVGGQAEIFTSPDGLARMRAAGAVAAAALSLAGRMIEAGGSPSSPSHLTTDAVDRAVHAFLLSRGAYPSPLGYHGFPRSVCVAVNECAAHGVPDGALLYRGDLVTVDVTAFHGGVHGDTNATWFVGGGGGGASPPSSPSSSPSPAAVELVAAAREALEAAIAVCGPGVPFSEVGRAVQRVADRQGLSVVRELVGHGIGRVFHALPAVAHHREWGARAAARGRMALGQAFTIEPILTLGGRRLAPPWSCDGWTVLTADGALAAQFEHTLVIGEGGAEVVTRRAGEVGGGGGG